MSAKIVICPRCGQRIPVPDDGGRYQVGWCVGVRVGAIVPESETIERCVNRVPFNPIGGEALIDAFNDGDLPIGDLAGT